MLSGAVTVTIAGTPAARAGDIGLAPTCVSFAPVFMVGSLIAGTYRITFALERYFAASARPSFYPHVDIVFVVAATDDHYHVPLLLSPFGYSTYRGS